MLGEDVSVDDDEWALLKLPPKKAVYERLELMRIKMDAAEVNMKQRWERKRARKMEDLTEEERRVIEEEDIEARQVYSKIWDVLDFRKMRVTDTGRHRRTVLSEELTVEEEASMEVRRNTWLRIYERFMKDNCDDDGNVKDGILNNQQKRRLKKLCQRIKAGEIVVTKTDKSGRFFVSKTEDYEEKGRVHVGTDREIGRKEVSRIETRLNTLTEVWVKAFNVGEDHGDNNVVRVRKGYTTNAGVVPPMYTMPKDHKPKTPGTPWPQSRPVCAASAAANSRSGDMVTRFVEALADGVEGSAECKSGEDMMAVMQQTNQKLKEEARRKSTGKIASKVVEDLLADAVTWEGKKIAGEIVHDMLEDILQPNQALAGGIFEDILVDVWIGSSDSLEELGSISYLIGYLIGVLITRSLTRDYK